MVYHKSNKKIFDKIDLEAISKKLNKSENGKVSYHEGMEDVEIIKKELNKYKNYLNNEAEKNAQIEQYRMNEYFEGNLETTSNVLEDVEDLCEKVYNFIKKGGEKGVSRLNIRPLHNKDHRTSCEVLNKLINRKKIKENREGKDSEGKTNLVYKDSENESVNEK